VKVYFGGRSINIGHFGSSLHAAVAYDLALLHLRGYTVNTSHEEFRAVAPAVREVVQRAIETAASNARDKDLAHIAAFILNGEANLPFCELCQEAHRETHRDAPAKPGRKTEKPEQRSTSLHSTCRGRVKAKARNEAVTVSPIDVLAKTASERIRPADEFPPSRATPRKLGQHKKRRRRDNTTAHARVEQKRQRLAHSYDKRPSSRGRDASGLRRACSEDY